MQVKYDEAVDAAYVYFRRFPVQRTERLHEGTLVDYGEDGAPVGLELLDVSDGVNLDGVPRADDVASVLQKLHFPVYA